MEKYSKPKRRNFLVKAMNLKSKPQVFHHRLEPKGGALNDQPELLEQAEDEHPWTSGEEEFYYDRDLCSVCEKHLTECECDNESESSEAEI
jgi:hypothetical protein